LTGNNLLYKLALSFIPGIGSVTAKTLVSYLGGVKQVFEAGKRELSRIPGIGRARSNEIVSGHAMRQAERSLKLIEKNNSQALFYLDKDYPLRLKNYVSSPLILYVKGNADLNAERMVGIVGTRNPSAEGNHNCEHIVDRLKDYNCSVISGLAYGIDSVAHSRSLQQGIPTIAVLGSGLDRIYPQINKGLSERILGNGSLISEFPFGTKPDRENFPKRNRIIAAFSDALIVVESAAKGGSIITAEYANAFSKDVFALPGRLSDPKSEGCNHLIKTHKAHMFQKIEDLAYICRWDQIPVQQKLSFFADLDENEKELVDLIRKNSPAGIDFLLEHSSVSLTVISSVLLNLELRGIIKSKAGKKYILA